MTRTVPPDRGHIATEQRNPRSMTLDSLSIEACVDLITNEDRHVHDAMRAARGSIASFLRDVEPRFLTGGRLIYLGAGTSGRLGVLDASEAPPTFQLEEGRIIGIIAGGDGALRRSSEGMEDDPDGARAELDRLRLNDRDAVLAIAAGGTTPYALGAMRLAKSAAPSCVTGLLTCAEVARPPHCDHLLHLPTGPEVLTGSTRMKAGTATKLALNTISTTLMVRAGKVYENLMVDLRASNDKLRDRAARIVATVTGIDRAAALDALDAAGGSAKVAIVMLRTGLSRDEAEQRLARAHGRLRAALGSQDPTIH